MCATFRVQALSISEALKENRGLLIFVRLLGWKKEERLSYKPKGT